MIAAFLISIINFPELVEAVLFLVVYQCWLSR